MKIALAQIITQSGKISENTSRIINSIEDAKQQKADLVIFPELSIPGYCAMDLFEDRQFLELNKQALYQIAENAKGIAVVVGFVDFNPKKKDSAGLFKRYNSAAFIENGVVKETIQKTLLPNYDVFSESRYFTPGNRLKVIPFKGVIIGIQICEDMWDENSEIKVSEQLVKKGAELIINISSSPFHKDKLSERQRRVKEIVSKIKKPFIYLNSVGAHDGYDGQLIFDGQSFVTSYQGKVLTTLPFCTESLTLADLTQKRSKINIKIDNPNLNQLQNSEQLLQLIIFGIKGYFENSNHSKAIIGLSGGIDSSLTAVLAAKALGPENVLGISLPSRFTSKQSIEDARKLSQNLKINFKVISIEEILNVTLESLSNKLTNLPLSNLALENLQARIRSNILMALANSTHSLLLATGNKTEISLGYTTLYGDTSGALAPLADLSKLLVYQLAHYINKVQDLIPASIIKRPPSAELKENQTDEQTLGPYSIISPLADDLIESSLSDSALGKKYSAQTISRVRELIKLNEFKRRQLPPGIKITKKSFGIGRRIPISYKSDEGKKGKKRALFIGRFQPFHKGHLSVIEELDQDPSVDEIIIGLGSSNVSHTSNNPFTAKERIRMLKKSINIKTTWQIIEIPDFNDNKIWTDYVVDSLPKFDLVVTGNALTNELFSERGYVVKDVQIIINISATKIREMIKKGEVWEGWVPEIVEKLIKSKSAWYRILELARA